MSFQAGHVTTNGRLMVLRPRCLPEHSGVEITMRRLGREEIALPIDRRVNFMDMRMLLKKAVVNIKGITVNDEPVSTVDGLWQSPGLNELLQEILNVMCEDEINRFSLPVQDIVVEMPRAISSKFSQSKAMERAR